jgi:hypothetical protein
VEIWIHTCWGNPNMQRVMEDTSYKASFELYLNEMKADVWTIETKDRDFSDIELFGSYKGKLPKKICVGAVSHRVLQADRAEDVAASIRRALEHIAPEQLIVSSDCGFGVRAVTGRLRSTRPAPSLKVATLSGESSAWKTVWYRPPIPRCSSTSCPKPPPDSAREELTIHGFDVSPRGSSATRSPALTVS